MTDFRLYLYKPELKDYWYEQRVLSDSKTMKYNAGWEVTYEGYGYNTGCIDFKEDKWLKTLIRD